MRQRLGSLIAERYGTEPPNGGLASGASHAQQDKAPAGGAPKAKLQGASALAATAEKPEEGRATSKKKAARPSRRGPTDRDPAEPSSASLDKNGRGSELNGTTASMAATGSLRMGTHHSETKQLQNMESSLAAAESGAQPSSSNKKSKTAAQRAPRKSSDVATASRTGRNGK